MLPEVAIRLIAPAIDNTLSAQTWADLGCGSGTFTRALASVLPPSSHIHAIDQQQQSLPQQFRNADIAFRQADFGQEPLLLNNLDGILLANALHYIKEAQSLLKRLSGYLTPGGRFLLVEYDRRRANRWVPYPISFEDAKEMFAAINFANILKIDEQPSAYGQATLYSCVASR